MLNNYVWLAKIKKLWYSLRMPTNNVKLTFTIENSAPVDLVNLAVGLNSFAKLYSDFNDGNAEAKLLVKEVRKGSIEIDLVTLCAAGVIPLISDVNNIVQFAGYIKLLVATASGATTEEVQQITADNYFPQPKIKDFKNFKDTLNILGNASDTIKIDAIDNENGNVFVGCTFNGSQAARMKEKITEIVQEKENNLKYTKQLFRWSQTNFDSPKTGNMGKIENITPKSLRVIFENDIIKNEMTISDVDVEWQNKPTLWTYWLNYSPLQL